MCASVHPTRDVGKHAQAHAGAIVDDHVQVAVFFSEETPEPKPKLRQARAAEVHDEEVVRCTRMRATKHQASAVRDVPGFWRDHHAVNAHVKGPRRAVAKRGRRSQSFDDAEAIAIKVARGRSRGGARRLGHWHGTEVDSAQHLDGARV